MLVLNESLITMRESTPGDRFDDMVDLYVVYISEFDFINGGRTTYHVDKVIRETGRIADDGVTEIYVNTSVDDNSDIAELMSCFKLTAVDNPKFPELSREVRKIKETEGGTARMCQIMQNYENIARQEGRVETLWSLVEQNLLSISEAVKNSGMSEEDFMAAKPEKETR